MSFESYVNYVQSKDKCKGRKPFWYKKFLNEFQGRSTYQEKHITDFFNRHKSEIELYYELKNKTRESKNYKLRCKINDFWKMRNCLDDRIFDKSLINRIIEFPEICNHEKVMSILLKLINDFTVLDEDMKYVQFHLRSLLF